MAESGLPALLLQCLYLFYVFPVDKDEPLESDLQGQRMFVQVRETGPPTLGCDLAPKADCRGLLES